MNTTNTTVAERDRTPVDGVDVCVVGAGIAGGLVAYELAKRGHSVVILEAGPYLDDRSRRSRMETALRPEHGTFEIWEGGIDMDRDRYTESTPGNLDVELNRNRLKAVGGTTLHWAAHVPRMHEKDFNMESRYGLASDWPLEYGDVRPYYARAEREIGVAGGGDNPFVPREEPAPMDAHPPTRTDELYHEVCERLGIRTHSNPLAINTEVFDGRSECVGFSTCSPVCPSGARYSGDVHIHKAQAEGAVVIDRAPVQRLEHDDSGSAVDAAVYLAPDGAEHAQQAAQFVLASGGIETPRLLLLSASDQYPDGLANTSNTVGKYLHFECVVTVRADYDQPTSDTPVDFLTTVSEQFYDHDDPRPGSFRLRFRNEDPTPPLSTALGARGPLREPFQGTPWGDSLLDHVEHAADNRALRIDAQVEMLPRKENLVALDDSETDTFGNPVPHISLDVGDHVVETGEAAIDVIQRIFDEMGASVTSVSDPADQRFRFHHKGTTRMGADPTESVVDARLRTHDVRNLWIASSSVFASGGAVNPTLTIAALALKAADHIDEAL